MAILADKVAVVTGGTRGLGLGLARAFAAEGAAVVVASRSPRSVEAAVTQLRSNGYRAAGLPVEVGHLPQVQALAEYARHEFGRLDIWVNNAGVAGPYGPALGWAPEVFYHVMQTNMIGVYHGSRTALQYFLAQGSGKLINVLGDGYKRPLPWQNAYGSSKSWVRSFTLALAAETKGRGVEVFAFNPGLVLTDLITDVEVISGSEARLQVFPKIVRMWAKSPEIPAQKAVWLASSATDGKTGLLVSLFSLRLMLHGAVREGLRTLLKRPVPPLEMKIKTIPFAEE